MRQNTHVGVSSGRSRVQRLEFTMDKACVLRQVQCLQEADTKTELNVQGFDERKCL